MKFKELEKEIERTYTEGVTLEEAEKLAARFLGAQLEVSSLLKKADLDARMKKSGLKAVKAAVYLVEVQSKDKKPTEAMLTSIIDTDPTAQQAQDGYDKAEVDKAELDRHYDIFLNAHIYYRGLAKGSFGG